MFKRNKLYAVITASTLVTLSSVAFSQETTTETVTVEVSNGFTLTSTTAFDFGRIRATQTASPAATAPAGISIAADGTVSQLNATGTASISSITDGNPARFDITDASPFTNLTISVDNSLVPYNEAGANAARFQVVGMNDVALTTPGGSATDAFILDVESDDIRVEGGLNDQATYSQGTPNLRTDATGAVGFTVGGVLTIPVGGTSSPTDGIYTGSYSVTVDY